MDVLVLVAIGLSVWAQFKVQGNFNRWSEVNCSSGMSGVQVARCILDKNGLTHIPIEAVPGRLTDYYDPIARTVRLSEEVYYGHSIASVSVAAHEVGHAIQHEQAYGFLTIRHRMLPVFHFAAGIAPFFLLVGFLFQALSLIGIGILFFSTAIVFQLLLLPIEFNASTRAKNLMAAEGIVRDTDKAGVNKVLGAAALTYLAGALISVVELITYITTFFQRNKEQ